MSNQADTLGAGRQCDRSWLLVAWLGAWMVGAVSACNGGRDDFVGSSTTTNSQANPSESFPTSTSDSQDTGTSSTSASASTLDTHTSVEESTSSSAGALWKLGGVVRGIGQSRAWLALQTGSDPLAVAESLELADDGAFTFERRLHDGESYVVTVTNQPTAPDQTCTVSQGHGQATADVDNVVVTCVTPIRHVVLIQAEGLRVQDLSGGAVPTAVQWSKQWPFARDMQSAWPSDASTQWQAVLSAQAPDSPTAPACGWLKFLQRQGDFKAGLFTDDSSLAGLGCLADVATEVNDDAGQVWQAALQWMAKERPTLTLIHLGKLHAIGQRDGWGSASYNQELAKFEGRLQALNDTLASTKLERYAAVVLWGGHGGIERDAVSDVPAVRTVPLVMRSPQGQPGEIAFELQPWDIGASAAAWLGAQPDVSHGRLIGTSVFPPVWPAALDPVPDVVSRPLIAKQLHQVGALYTAESTPFATLWRPIVDPGWYELGDVVVPVDTMPGDRSWRIATSEGAVAVPLGYEKIWTEQRSDIHDPLTLWRPLPPLGYICLGLVATPAAVNTVDRPALRCVHQDLLERAQGLWVASSSALASGTSVELFTCPAYGEKTARGPQTSWVRLAAQPSSSLQSPGCWLFSRGI